MERFLPLSCGPDGLKADAGTWYVVSVKVLVKARQRTVIFGGKSLCQAALVATTCSRIWRSEDGLPRTRSAILRRPVFAIFDRNARGLGAYLMLSAVVNNPLNTLSASTASCARSRRGWFALSLPQEVVSLPHRGNWAICHFGANEGLSNGFIRSIYADHGGTLWVGSDRGFFRREGNRFVRLDGTPDIPLLSVRSIAEDSGHRLWVATLSDLHRDVGRPGKASASGEAHVARSPCPYAAPYERRSLSNAK